MQSKETQAAKRRAITLAEFVTLSFLVLGIVLGVWNNTMVRLTAIELEIVTIKANNANRELDSRASIKELIDNQKDLQKGINEIKITLQDKQNRK